MIFDDVRDQMRDVLGPLADLRSAVDGSASGFAVIRGVMPVGVTVPLPAPTAHRAQAGWRGLLARGKGLEKARPRTACGRADHVERSRLS